MINCLGCRNGKVRTFYCDRMCEIRRCATDKGKDFCTHCSKVDGCEYMKPLVETNDEARDNLAKLR